MLLALGLTDLSHMPALDWCRSPRGWVLLCAQKVDWHRLPGGGIWPEWAWKEQGRGAPHSPLCNWWIKGAWMAQMDSGVLAAHGGPGLEAGQLWILLPRPGPHPCKSIGREESETQPPIPVASWKTSRTHLRGLKSAGGSFFFFPLSFSSFFSSPKWDNKMWNYERSRNRSKGGA